MPFASAPLIRAAVLAGYPALAGSIGIDAAVALRDARIPPEALTDPDRRIPVMRLNQLLRSTAAAGQTESVGLRLSGEIHPDRLGLLGLILSHTATAGEAFEVVSRLSQLHNEALYLWTERDGGHLTARLEYMIHSATSVREIIEMTAGVIALNLRAIIGADWNPQLVCFRHAPPPTTRFHRQVFRCPVRFATDVDGLVCLTRDFSRRNQLVGQGSVDFVREALARAARTTGDPTLRLTQRFIWALLPSGNCTTDNVARLLGVDRRTLHRRLSRHGETFTTLLDAVRIELATRHVRLGLRPLADVAVLLGFRSQSDFSHWFVRHFGMPPSKWRKRLTLAQDRRDAR